MAKVTKKAAAKDAAPKAAAPKAFNPGGSPVGWSFWTTTMTCWRMWFLKYVEGLSPIETPKELLLGSAYHGLMEGHSSAVITAHDPKYKSVIDEAMRLYISRKSPGAPPMPKDIVSAEETLNVPGIPMTSKPDRIERTSSGKVQVREFKTANRFTENDSHKWSVSGEVIGEMMAANVDTAIVDIIEKKGGKVQQLEVKLTDEKRGSLVGLITALKAELTPRMEQYRAAKSVSPSPNLDRVFPKNLNACGYQFGNPCPFFARCWGRSAATHLFERKPVSVWRSYLGVPEKD